MATTKKTSTKAKPTLTEEIPAKKKGTTKPRSALVGSGTQPTVLDKTTKLDIDTKKVLIDNIIDTALVGRLDTSELDRFTSISNARDQVYQLMDTMCQDSVVSSIIRTYAEDVCAPSDNGHIMWAESSNPKISKFVNYLLNTMNVDKNVYGWTYCLLKYGDVYLRLYRESDYDDRIFKKEHIEGANQALNEAIKLNVHTADDPYSYYVEMVYDPSTMFELTKYGTTYGYIEVPNARNTQYDFSQAFMGGTATNIFNYRLKTNDINIYQADDFVHACLEDNFTRFPETVQIYTSDGDYDSDSNALAYNVKRGKSILYDSYKIWREKALLENATLLNRITRSSILRKVMVEVGDMPKEQVQATLRRVKDMIEQKTALNKDGSMYEYANPGPAENFIYGATHNGQGTITIDSVGGDIDVKNLADLEWWNNKFYSSYGIPKQYFGWTEDGAGFNGGTALTITSSVYSKGVQRVQNAMIQAVTDIINLILVSKGMKSYINNFTLKMHAPITQEEIDYRNAMTNKINAISNAQSLFADIEDKGRKLIILKGLISSLNYGNDIIDQIDLEIAAYNQSKKEEAAAAAMEALAAEGAATEAPATPEAPAEEIPVEEAPAEETDMELTPMPNEALPEETPAKEGFKATENTTILTEEQELTEDDDLPTPEDAAKDKDFTENN